MHRPLMAVLMAGAVATLAPLAQAADLLQVYQQALANDANYAAARATLTAGRQRITQGRAGLLPTIAASGSNTRNTSNLTQSLDQFLQVPNDPADGGDPVVSDSKYHSNTYTVSLSQPLYDWAAWQQYQQSKLQQANSEAVFAQAQEDLITRVAQAYFDVLAAEDSLESTRAQKVATTEQLAWAKRNHEIGTQTITDTHEAQAAYDQVVAQEIAGINDVRNRRATLRVIIGTRPGTLAPLRPGVVIAAPQPAVIEPWVASAEEQNYAVVSARLGLEVARRQIQVDRAGHMPTASIIASNTYTNQTSTGITKGSSIGVQWSIPIFSGFAVTSRVREAIALEEKSRDDLDATRRNAALAAELAFLDMNSGLAQVKALEAAEVSSKSSLASNKLGYQVGVRINIDVLNAQKLLYSTQKDLSKARYDTIMSGLRLQAAAGTLKEADLGPVNALLLH